MSAKVAKTCSMVVACLFVMLAALAFSETTPPAYAADGASAAGPLAPGVASAQEAAGDAADSAGKSDEEAKAEAAQAEKQQRKTVDDGLYNIGSLSMADSSVAVNNGSVRAGAAAVVAARDEADWSQKWAIAWDEESGYYTIRNFKSRKYLGVSGKVKSGAALRQVSAAKSKAQLWEPTVVADGVVLKSAGSKYALVVKAGADGSARLVLKSAKSGNAAARTFKLGAVDPIEADRTYFINKAGTKKRIQVKGNSRNGGAPLTIARAKDTKAQKFRVVKAGSAYRLQCVRSCCFVGAKGSSVRQMEGRRGAAKKWKLEFNPKTAAFSIVSNSTGKCLNAASRKLTLKKRSNTAAQQFTFASTYAFKLYLNPGHGWNSNGNGAWDSGAVGGGYEEAQFASDLAHRVEDILAGSDVQVINGEQFSNAFWERMPKAVSLGCDAIVSIHFDAGGGSGTLKMVGVQGKAPGSEELAQAIHEGVLSSLGLPDRGPSPRSDITCVNGPIPSMLTEICFMDNLSDVATYLPKRQQVAEGLAAGILKASRDRAVIG